jgi:uncharacterized protein (TIGR02099 family)
MLLFILNVVRISMVSLLVIGVLTAATLRLSLSWLSQHPTQISTWLSERWSIPIQITQLQTDWSAGLPTIQATGLTVGNSPYALHLTQARLSWGTSGLTVVLSHPLGPVHISTPNLVAPDTAQIIWPALTTPPIHLQYDQPTSQISLQATDLSLATLHKLLATHPILADAPAWLDSLQPTGVLQDIRLTWSPHTTWRLQAHISNLTTQPAAYWPGIKHWQVALEAQPDRFQANLTAEHTLLNYPNLFRAPLNVTHLTTELHGARTAEQGWQITADAIQLTTPHFSSNSQLHLTLTPQRSPYLDLRTQLHDGNLAAVTHYLPAHIMSPKLVRWLDHALRDGQIVQSDLILQGPLDRFPYTAKQQGNFAVNTQIRDATLAFHPDWPTLHIDQMQLTFEHNQMQADLTAGRLLHSPVQTQARIAHLSASSPLQLEISADGPASDLITLLQAPTLSPTIQTLAARMQINGSAHSQLQIQLPLKSQQDPAQVNGTVQLTDAELQLPEVQLKQMHGTLSVHNNQLQAENVQATLRGQPVKLAIRPEPEQTLILLNQRLDATTLATWLPRFPTQLIHGSTPVQLSLAIPQLQHPGQWFSQLQLNSDLRGLAIRLPPPMGKTRQTTRPLQLALSLGNQTQPHTLRYGRNGHSIFSHDWQRGAISYAQPRPHLPDSGYRLSGTFKQLDLLAWQDIWQQLPATTDSSAPWQINLSADQLTYGALSSDQAKLQVTHQQQHIQATLDSQQLQGEVHYDMTKDKLKAYLPKAHLNWPTDNKTRPDGKTATQVNWPELAILCDDLRINQLTLGKLMLRTQNTPTAHTLQQLTIQGNNLQLQLQGAWQQPDDQTRLEGEFQFNDLGSGLAQWGYPRQLHEAPAQGKFTLRWPGRPEQFRLTKTTGQADIQLGPGRLTQMSPGITRVLGLINVDTLQRRLKLDFDDLLKKGHSFDQVQGYFELRQGGQLHTRHLQINGPTSYIQLAGRIGLIQQDLEQLAYIIPKLDGTLLLAGALTGGPVGTLTSLLVQQLLSRQVDSFTRFTYQITGTWKQPEITDISTVPATSDTVRALQGQVAKPHQRSILQRLRDALRPTEDMPGWTNEELLELEE